MFKVNNKPETPRKRRKQRKEKEEEGGDAGMVGARGRGAMGTPMGVLVTFFFLALVDGRLGYRHMASHLALRSDSHVQRLSLIHI